MSLTKLQDQQKDEREQWRADLEGVMSTASGRRVLFNWIKGTGFWNSTTGSDDRQTIIKSARRDVGAEQWSALGDVCPNERREMTLENLETT